MGWLHRETASIERRCNIMYAPRRLQGNFVLKDEKYGTNIITKGALSCCGQYDFSVSYFGELRTDWRGNVSIFPQYDALALTAKCKVCGKEIQVFNSFTDGYDNCVNKTELQSMPAMSMFPCSRCSSDYFSIEQTFEYQSREELEEEGVQEYENAFSWIWVSLTCTTCKKLFKNLVDLETS